ncbi:hypothetical protein [Aquibium sp. ELW1220]|uniref:hypothetical protein n=1 Tax=Aquibium sp. ELW1220 TaxID=2976766 RepID=UPI0025AF4FD9|nr:hypothetical protein [Aquibium sp. ELW1220]MDN2584003.1 hypothetical protein [Aquibium sp. ELW1220]
MFRHARDIRESPADARTRLAGALEAEMQNDPTLDELLDEPIVRMLMASDRVSAWDIRRLMDEARRRAAWKNPPRSPEPCRVAAR